MTLPRHPIPIATLDRMDDGYILSYANGRFLDNKDSSFKEDEWRYYLDYLYRRRNAEKKPPPKVPTPPGKSVA